MFIVSVKAATNAMVIRRAKRSGDGTFGHSEEPDPSADFHCE